MDKTTTRHDEIREWATRLGGKPEIIPTGDESTHTGLRINFPGAVDDEFLSRKNKPKPVSWDEFFRVFDDQELAFSYKDRTIGNDPSLWYRFTYRSVPETDT